MNLNNLFSQKTLLLSLAVFIIILNFLSLSFFSTPALADWSQEAHDAQHTGYTDEDVSTPWTFKWQWNGSCSDGTDCRPGNPELGWSFQIPPRSHPVTGNGRLYLPAGSHGVYAIRESDGKTAWHNSSVQSFCTAAFDSESQTVFVAGSDGRLYKLNSANGTILGSFNANNGLNQAPIIAAGRVFVVSDNGTLYAVNKDTMSQVWSYSANSPAQTPPAYSLRYDVLVFATEDLYVHAINNSDGLRRWRVKPTVNSPGDLSYNGGDGRSYRAHNWEHGWPVIAEDHGLVMVRLRLLIQHTIVDNPDGNNWYPNTNAKIRTMLINHPDWQTLFPLNLNDGSLAFVPAVGHGGAETPDKKSILGPLPVVKRLSGGTEVVYTIWRNGQKCEARDCSDPRWDAVMGEMVLDNTTISGYQAGDLRFINYNGGGATDGNGIITDEMCKVSMAGTTIFHSHWIAMRAYRITDRNFPLGGTYASPIRTQAQGFVVNKASNELAWVTCQPNSSHYCGGSLDTYGDRRVFNNAFWVFFNDCEPPYDNYCCDSFDCVYPFSVGYTASYIITNNGAIYFETNGGSIFALATQGGGPTPTPTPDPVCQYDNDGNHSLGVGDLLYILSHWDSSGLTQLLTILRNWGRSCS